MDKEAARKIQRKQGMNKNGGLHSVTHGWGQIEQEIRRPGLNSPDAHRLIAPNAGLYPSSHRYSERLQP